LGSRQTRGCSSEIAFVCRLFIVITLSLCSAKFETLTNLITVIIAVHIIVTLLCVIDSDFKAMQKTAGKYGVHGRPRNVRIRNVCVLFVLHTDNYRA